MASPYVGTRVSQAIMNQIKQDVESGEFCSPAEWVREACRRFYEIRKVDRAGGGALTKFRPVAKKFWGDRIGINPFATLFLP